MTTTIPQQVVNARRIAGVILVLSALATVIMLVILAAWWSTQPPSVAGATGSPSNTPTIAASVPAQPAIQPSVSPQVALEHEADGDRQQVEALVGSWVPQLSSKTVGLEADGITYGYSEILDHFNWLKARYPQALLLRSDGYASFEMSGYWIIVMPVTYTSGAEANSWCDYEGIDPDNCFAKLLRHTGEASGTTLFRQ
jgi:hypothetical protein